MRILMLQCVTITCHLSWQQNTGSKFVLSFENYLMHVEIEDDYGNYSKIYIILKVTVTPKQEMSSWGYWW